MIQSSRLYKFHNLRLARQKHTERVPYAHQMEALEHLDQWFSQKHSCHGGILTLPTGGGKTFTAVRFLCTGPLSQGYKVLWLAHTHHLLEQAFHAFDSEVKYILPPRNRLDIRVVSGAQNHYAVKDIKSKDDVIIATLQTITRAYNNKQTNFNDFLKLSCEQLFIVFDEAHHSPSPVYRKFIFSLREHFADKVYLLGLTATPQTSHSKAAWLIKLFPQEIIYQVTAQRLMVDGILSRPKIEQHPTYMQAPEIDQDDYRTWIKTCQDLPESLITRLAQNRERNLFIAETYAKNKAAYEKTIIFADRWYQCEQIKEFLQIRGVKSEAVYSGSSERKKLRDEINAKAINDFRQNKIDVLVNVRILAEGTDIPNIKSIFLTRETTSEILLLQMIGRALRGPRIGGTDEAYIVSFIDIWNYEINWARYYDVIPGIVNIDDENQQRRSGNSLEIGYAELVRQLSRNMNKNIKILAQPFITLLPIGWYKIEIEQALSLGSSDIKTSMIMVFEGEKEHYKKCIEIIKLQYMQYFESIYIDYISENINLLNDICIKAFCSGDNPLEFPDGPDFNLLLNLSDIAQHIAQHDGDSPTFFSFEDREKHDLEAIAYKIINQDLGPRKSEELLKDEFFKKDRYWRIIYYSYDTFKNHYNACVDRILSQEAASTPVLIARTLKIHDTSLESNTPNALQASNTLSEKPRKFDLVHNPEQYLQLENLPSQSANIEEWKDFICRSIDKYLNCCAVYEFSVDSVNWYVSFYPDVDHESCREYMKMLASNVEKVLLSDSPQRIIVNTKIRVRLKSSTKQYSNSPKSYQRWQWGIRSLKDSIKRAEVKAKESDVSSQADCGFNEGDLIIVTKGPFRGFKGQVIEVDCSDTAIKALLQIFGRDTPVKLQIDHVTIENTPNEDITQ